MKLRIVERVAAEIIHCFEPATQTLIHSTGHRLTVQMGGQRQEFTLPLALGRRAVGQSRLVRRVLRLDKMNAVLTADRRAVVVLYQGHMYRCDLERRDVQRTGTLRQSRNALHGGVCLTAEGYVCFGEYGGNSRRDSVPIWLSTDHGCSWKVAFEFPAGAIKHVHGVYLDPYGGKLWIPTGDFDGECSIHETDTSFAQMRRHGNGTQAWRPVSLLFEPDHILWGMDSPLETSYLQVFDRASGMLQRGRSFPGPVWYSKRLDGLSLLQSTCEAGPGLQSDSAHLFVSGDNREWVEVTRYTKDRWPMGLFKFGVIAFADGVQSRDRFAMFGEALVGFDGQSVIAALDDE